MPATKHFLWIVPFAAISTAALGQAASGIGGGTGSTVGSGSTGFGIPAVPNNSLPPLPGSATPSLSTTPGPSTTTPGLSTTTPGLSTATPGLSTTTPGLSTSTTPGVIIELSPPSPSVPSSTFDSLRTCPSGITFC